jgi:hypothetical protein
MQTETVILPKIEDRCSELQNWILHNAPHCMDEEKQLVEGSEERAYWAHGYMTALADVLRLFAKGRVKPHCRSVNRDIPRRVA